MEKIVLFLIVIFIFVLFFIRVTVDNKRNVEKLRREFHKGNFLIGMYNLDDELVYMFDNVRHMSKTLKIKESLLAPRLSRNHKFRYKNEWYILKLIEVGED